MPSPSLKSTASAPSDKRRWNAFVCQDCRAIFRVPADYEGAGVVCPSCDRMLRIPRAGESIPTLVQGETDDVTHPESERALIHKIEEIEQEVIVETPILNEEPLSVPAVVDQAPSLTPTGGEWKRRKKHRDRSKDLESEWQQNDKKVMLRFSRRVPLVWWWIGSVLLLLSIGGIVVTMLPKRNSSPPIVDMPDMVVLPDAIADTSQTSSTTLQQMAAVREAQAVMGQFVNANSVETILTLSRPVTELENRMNAYYAKYPIKPLKFDAIDYLDASSRADQSIVTAQVRFSNFLVQPITAIKVNGTYLIDWESWVGWSEMEYDALMVQKPITPKEVRVMVHEESYYNYDFPNSSESEWKSYRLKFTGENQEIHGYVKRSSELNSLLASSSDQQAKPMILHIRYQNADSHASQVLIDSVVVEGWVKGLPIP